ncbi:MAG: ABC transporter substrate-binding protein, partial [Spirochaetia bacterium]|nr:ABC transporter substrate-binding protein [Spirochaetia bacterium]
MKKLAILIIALMLPTLLFAQPATETKQDSVAIGISKMVAHPALDAIEQGIQDYLNSTTIKATFDLQNCNAEIGTAIAIAQKFKSDKKDLVIGIATPPAQALAQVITDRPVVFGAITDPLAAGLVANYDRTEATNIAGISDLNPVELQLDTFFSITNAKRLGMIYTSSEANGVAMMELARDICKERGIEFIA